MHGVSELAPIEYRPYPGMQKTGVGCAVFYGLGTVAPFVLSFWIEKMMPPGMWVIYTVFSAVFLGMFLGSVWIVLYSRRHRLQLTPEIIRSVGCFSTREIVLARIRGIVWSSISETGSVLLDDGHSRLRIGFGDYTHPERLELTQRLRAALPEHEQVGWRRFDERYLPPPTDWSEVESRLRTEGVVVCRDTRAPFWCGVLCAATCAIAGVVSVPLVLTDPAERNPVAVVTKFSILFAGTFAFSCWLAMLSIRRPLRITPDLVRWTPGFRAEEIRVADVNQVVWQSVGAGGIELQGAPTSMRVSFRGLTRRQLAEAVHVLRIAVAGRPQEGWEEFDSRHMQPATSAEIVAEARRIRRFVTIACGIAMPVGSAITLYTKSLGGLPHMSWLVAGLAPAVWLVPLFGLIWFGTRPAVRCKDEPQVE